MGLETCAIDDSGPMPVERPGSVAELRNLVRQAEALFPAGGRTTLDLGTPPAREGIVVDLRGLNQVIEFAARDMTLTVQAGITLAEIDRLLSSENLRLPIDVPRPEQATLGGAIAVNASGPRRHGFGTFRDFIIGITVVDDQGRETRAGGRVVKNVAGYDLCKLHVGALGTLGLITQVTLKLRPRAEASSLVTLGCQTGQLGRVLDLLHVSRTRPVVLDVLHARAVAALPHLAVSGPQTPWVIVLGYEEAGDAVRWQISQLIRETATAPVEGLSVHVERVAGPLWEELRDFPLLPGSVLSFKANLPPHVVAGFLEHLAGLPEAPLLQAQAGNGIVRGHFPDLTAERAAGILKEMQALAGSDCGNVIVCRCPADWKRSLPVWGLPPGDRWLMRRVKEQLSPRELFNPGRFLV